MRVFKAATGEACTPVQLPTTDTSDCTYHCNQTRSPVSQSNERKVAPREIKKPHVSNLAKPLAAFPPPVIYCMSCQRTLPVPSMSKSSSPPLPPFHLSPHPC